MNSKDESLLGSRALNTYVSGTLAVLLAELHMQGALDANRFAASLIEVIDSVGEDFPGNEQHKLATLFKSVMLKAVGTSEAEVAARNDEAEKT